MKLERHMAVVIGVNLEASSTALHGTGNARLAWFFAQVAMTLVILVGAGGPRGTTSWVGFVSLVCRRLERSAGCRSCDVPIPCPILGRRTLGRHTLSGSLGTLGSALL